MTLSAATEPAPDPAPEVGSTPAPLPGRTVPAAVLWDMDGTLVDSEPAWIAAEFALVERHGGTWSHDRAHAIVGSDLLVAAAYIARHGGVDLPPERIVELLLDDVVAAVARHVAWRPGARELLAGVRAAGVPCALVTMSYRRLVDAVVSTLPAGTFAAVVTGDEVARGKPDAEPYRTAAALLGVAPGECLAIEDSPTGAASARAAGVPVLAVPHVVPVGPGPGLVVLPGLDGVGTGDLPGLAATARGSVGRDHPAAVAEL